MYQENKSYQVSYEKQFYQFRCQNSNKKGFLWLLMQQSFTSSMLFLE